MNKNDKNINDQNDLFKLHLENNNLEECSNLILENDKFRDIKLLMVDIIRFYTQNKFRSIFNLNNQESGTLEKRYRKLASTLHPDKCPVPGSQYVFQCLQDSYQRVKSDNSFYKKGDIFRDTCSKFEFDNVENVDKEKGVKERGDGVLSEDEKYLRTLTMQGLKEEVKKRQRGLFSRGDSDGDDMQNRNKKLKLARKILSEGCCKEREQNAESNCGGFLNEKLRGG
eukprot:TRINITY_DN14734_c0_g2_i2.p2 TRINITY_DN14734_c0_g2~~TRINITY_DN14734_c0_g2_i2.p2  ORF type:complete len:226 (+),score=34.82 TRINITY_DN14734_c0_g2_i2:305-982(+)